MQSGVRVVEGRRGGVNARRRVLRPKQQDGVGFRFCRVYIAFRSRNRTMVVSSSNAKREDERVLWRAKWTCVGVCERERVDEWHKGVSAVEAQCRSRPLWWKRIEGGPPGERLAVGPFRLEAFTVEHGLMAPGPSEALGSPQLPGMPWQRLANYCVSMRQGGILDAHCLQPHSPSPHCSISPCCLGVDSISASKHEFEPLGKRGWPCRGLVVFDGPVSTCSFDRQIYWIRCDPDFAPRPVHSGAGASRVAAFAKT
jgi:hypothetical protein